MVGFATLPYGVVNVCVSFSTGRLVKYVGRIPLFVFGKYFCENCNEKYLR